jgi:hypothetical protein
LCNDGDVTSHPKRDPTPRAGWWGRRAVGHPGLVGGTPTVKRGELRGAGIGGDERIR